MSRNQAALREQVVSHIQIAQNYIAGRGPGKKALETEADHIIALFDRYSSERAIDEREYAKRFMSVRRIKDYERNLERLADPKVEKGIE